MELLRIICFLFFLIKCESARILAVFPIPAYSHQVTFRPYTQELAKRGHEVTVITSHPAFPKGKTPENFTEIDVHEAGEEIRKEFFSEVVKFNGLIEQQTMTINVFSRAMEKYLSLGLLDEFLNNKTHQFDLVVVEASVKQALVFSHVFQAPAIQLSSFGGYLGTFEAVGASTHPLLYPSIVRQRFQNLTMWNKLLEYFNHYYMMWIYYRAENYNNMVIKKYFGPNVPELSKLNKNIALLFLNIHSVWDSNRPVPPNVIYLGELNKNKPKRLQQEIQSYLDSSKHGVIYVSFGTNINKGILTHERLQIIIKVLSELPYDVLMKNDGVEAIDPSIKNIRLFDWVPQTGVLNHPKVKLFITQGGLQSSHEAIEAGVPLIGIPLMWDQMLNVDKYVKFKIGLQLDIYSLNEDTFKTSVETVLGNGSFRTNIEKLRTIMNDQPQTPVEKAVWWTEYVLKYGGEHLGSESAYVEWSEYYEIELIVSVLTAVIVIIISGLLLMKRFLRYTNIDKR